MWVFILWFVDGNVFGVWDGLGNCGFEFVYYFFDYGFFWFWDGDFVSDGLCVLVL